MRKSFVFSRGRLHELPEGMILMVPTRMAPFAFSSLISWPGKLRMGMDLVLPRGSADKSDESLGDFVRRRLGREALAKVAEPIVAGIHAGDPEQMSVRATFPMFMEMEQEHRSLILGMVARRRARARRQAAATAAPKRPRSYFLSFETGLADLSDAVVAALPAECLRTGVGVESIAADPKGGYRLELSDGGADVCDAVVLAAPAFAAAALLRGVAPAAADGLGTIPYVSTATVSLAFRQDQLPGAAAPRGFGFVVPRAEKRGIMATTYSSSKFPGRAPDGHVLVRSFVGRAGREEPAALPDRETRRPGPQRAVQHPRDPGRAAVHQHLPLAAGHAAVSRRPPRTGRRDRGGGRRGARRGDRRRLPTRHRDRRLHPRGRGRFAARPRPPRARGRAAGARRSRTSCRPATVSATRGSPRAEWRYRTRAWTTPLDESPTAIPMTTRRMSRPQSARLTAPIQIPAVARPVGAPFSRPSRRPMTLSTMPTTDRITGTTNSPASEQMKPATASPGVPGRCGAYA